MNTNPALDIDSRQQFVSELAFYLRAKKKSILTRNTYFQGDQKFWKMVFTRGKRRKEEERRRRKWWMDALCKTFGDESRSVCRSIR